MGIYIYITGNLVAETLIVAAQGIAEHCPSQKLILFTTGNLLININLSGFELLSVSEDLTEIKFSPGDILISGIMWPGFIERKIIQKVKAEGGISVVILADLGGDAAKFKDENVNLLPDYICIADKTTFNNLISEGVPDERIMKIGSLYLDQIDAIAGSSSAQLAYCSVPNQSDYLNWGFDLGYSEVEIAEKLADICREKSIDLIIRKHPKEFGSHKYNHLRSDTVTIENHDESDTTDFLSNKKWVISSYSTSLIVAKKMGLPSLSFQPQCKNPLKELLFNTINIPVATSDEQVISFVENPGSTRCGLNEVVYNSGDSSTAFNNFIKCLVG